MSATVTELQGTTQACSSFKAVPVLDLSLIRSPRTKAHFLSQLREALVVVGFFYLENAEPWVSSDVREAFVDRSITLCNQPLEKKMEIQMANSKHFLGYSRMGLERTAMEVDNREMFDFLSPLPAPGPDDPIYLNVQGPNQWPDEQAVPGFRYALETYLAAVGDLGNTMISLVAEALELEASALTKFFNEPPRNKVSLLKYPEPTLLMQNGANGCQMAAATMHSAEVDQSLEMHDKEFQGVGSHKDGGFLTYLLQASPHLGLEVQNKTGDWILVPPLPNTFVVNVGRSLEAITHGVCQATTHRVSLSRQRFLTSNGDSLGPRFSFPMFQTLKLDLTTEQLLSLKLPDHIANLVKDEKVKSDAESYFAKYHLQSPGMGIFTARLTSHPDVGRRWYPEILERVLQEQKKFRI